MDHSSSEKINYTLAADFIETNPPLIKISKLCKKPQTVSTGLKNITIYKSGTDFLYAEERCHHRGMNLRHSTVEKSLEKLVKKTVEKASDSKEKVDAAANSKNSCLVCPYHGKKNAPLGKLVSAYGYLWFEAPKYFDAPDDHLFSGSTSIILDAPFHVVLDNFNEGSHTPFVHKYVGPDNLAGKFSWQSHADHVEINYQSIQRKNFLFYPFLRNYDLQWTIQWRTYSNPLYMRYESSWKNLKTQKEAMAKNITYFFLKPISKTQTEITTFVFIKPLGGYRWITPLVKKMSFWMTLNQIFEDKILYRKINDLPLSFSGLKLDQFDQPLVEIRKRAQKIYGDYLLPEVATEIGIPKTNRLQRSTINNHV